MGWHSFDRGPPEGIDKNITAGAQPGKQRKIMATSNLLGTRRGKLISFLLKFAAQQQVGARLFYAVSGVKLVDEAAAIELLNKFRVD